MEPEPNSGCWLWAASSFASGYGQFSTGSRRDGSTKNRRAHRVAYELFVGPIPVGLTLDHLCRVPCCVNPRHLEPVSIKENTYRGFSVAALNARKTRCWRGHPFNEANTRRINGSRVCRACGAQTMREIRARS